MITVGLDYMDCKKLVMDSFYLYTLCLSSDKRIIRICQNDF